MSNDRLDTYADRSERAKHIATTMQAMARGLDGYFFTYDGSDATLTGADFSMAVTDLDEPGIADVHGWGGEGQPIRQRFAKLTTLLQRFGDFDANECYLVVVSDWPKRAEEAAQWIASETQLDYTFVNWTPRFVDDAFDGERHFSPELPGDGNMRCAGMARLYSLLDGEGW